MSNNVQVTYLIQELQHGKWEPIFAFESPIIAINKLEEIIEQFPINDFRYIELIENIS